MVAIAMAQIRMFTEYSEAEIGMGRSIEMPGLINVECGQPRLSQEFGLEEGEDE